MTDEERKAIENIKEMIESIFKCEDDEEFVCDVSDGGYLQTALNLINKQEKAIDRMINWIERDCYYQDEFGNSCSIIQDSCFSNKDCKECIKEYFMEDKE